MQKPLSESAIWERSPHWPAEVRSPRQTRRWSTRYLSAIGRLTGNATRAGFTAPYKRASKPPARILLLYFDQAAPATSDWTAIHLPALERASCLIVIATPGLYAELGAGDWAHKELDWWLKNRKAAPILIDTTGEGDRWIPPKIKSRWPMAQRVNLAPDLWAQATEVEQQEARAQVVEQIVGGIRGSRLEVVAQDAARAGRFRRRFKKIVLAVLIIAALCGFGITAYRRSARYQVGIIIGSAPLADAADSLEPLEHYAMPLRHYMRALATFSPEKALETAEQITNVASKSVALSSVSAAQADMGQKEAARKTFQQALQTAQRIEDPISSVKALALIAAEQADAGQQEDALVAWQRCLSEAAYFPDQVFPFITLHSSAQQLPELARIVEHVKDPIHRATALAEIAGEQTSAKDTQAANETLAQAEKAAEQIQDPEQVAPILTSIAIEQVRLGRYREAEGTANKIPDRLTKVTALVRIAAEEAETDADEEAQRTVESLDSDYRPAALAMIAEARQIKVGLRMLYAWRTKPKTPRRCSLLSPVHKPEAGILKKPGKRQSS